MGREGSRKWKGGREGREEREAMKEREDANFPIQEL
jgi:hypothetical protein